MKPALIVGNWKMNGTQKEASALARSVRRGLGKIKGVEVAIAPPFTGLLTVQKIIRGSRLRLAAQNVHWEASGAFTGEISARMIRELGCRFAIVGHSERRQHFHETDETVSKRLAACLAEGLRPILCVGETLSQREGKETDRVIGTQLEVALKGLSKSDINDIEIAYEPVWAIGTGRNASPEQAAEVHGWIRNRLTDLFGRKYAAQCRILYGGSVRPENADQLLRTPEVNGVLVGGASLKSRDFLRIVRSLGATGT